MSATDERVFAEAVQSARIGGAADVAPAAFDFLCTLFTRPRLGPTEEEFVAGWQQLAPAVMAKGVEDTTFYLFDRLVSCNEVGSQASLMGISAEKFHEFCHYLSDRWPNNLLATSTHDNKRSEDVRTRISLAVGDSGSMGGGSASVVAAHRSGLEQPNTRPSRGVSAVPNPDRRVAFDARSAAGNTC